jgi:hypothetical protein
MPHVFSHLMNCKPGVKVLSVGCTMGEKVVVTALKVPIVM